MNEIDLCTVNSNEVEFEKKTYAQVIVGDIEPKVELVEYHPEPNPLLVTDLSLASLLASGNVEMLRPIGHISDTLLQAHDKVYDTVERIDIFSQNNIVESQINN